MPTILIVDDSPTIRKMVKATLNDGRHDFGEASNGLQAVEQLALRRYDLMILDLNMPDMHGLEVISYTRAYERYENLPILVLTTKSSDSTREEILAAGANLYRTKPFKPDDLRRAVDELLDG